MPDKMNITGALGLHQSAVAEALELHLAEAVRRANLLRKMGVHVDFNVSDVEDGDGVALDYEINLSLPGAR